MEFHSVWNLLFDAWDFANGISPLNILYLNLYSDLGGGEFSLLHLARLLDRKIKPLFLFARPGSFSRRLDSMGTGTVMLGYQPTMVSRLFLPWLFFRNLRAGFALTHLIRERRIDLVHCTDIFSLLLLLPAFLTTRIPIVYNVIMFYTRPQSVLFRWLAWRMVKRIVAPSQSIRKDLVERVGIKPERIEVLYNGVDTVTFAPSSPEKKAQVRKKLGIPPDRKVVGFAARYDAGKGHRTFLDAVPLLVNSNFQNRPRTSVVSGGDFSEGSEGMPSADSFGGESPHVFDGIIKQKPNSKAEIPNPQSPITNYQSPNSNLQSSIYNLQFLFAGGSPTEDVVSGVTHYREDLEPVFRTLEEQGVLRRLGHLDDMAEFYAALDLFVCPSDAEAFGLAVFEAFAAGLPIVVTRTTGAVELVGGCKGVTVIDPNDPAQLAAAVGKALRSGADEVDWEERRQVLKKWTWEEYAKGWETIYKHQIAKSKSQMTKKK